MQLIRRLPLLILAASILTACAPNRYLANRGNPEYQVTLINTCSRYIVRIWLDDEWSNRRKIFVPNRNIGSRPRTFQLPAGRHTFHLEFPGEEMLMIREGSFTVTGNDRFQLC